MTQFIDFFNENPHTTKILWTSLWIALSVAFIALLSKMLYEWIDDNARYHLIRKRVVYLVSFLLFLIIWTLWAESSDSIATYIGLLSAGIAVALRDLFSNIAAWFFLMTKKPFEIGQRIAIGPQQGDVIDIRLFQFTLMEISSTNAGEQSTGRIVDIPNHYVFNHPVVNYTKGFQYIWSEIPVLLTFESDWILAKELLTQIVNRHALHFSDEAASQIDKAARKYMIQYNHLTPIVYTDVKESGVELTLRYLCEPKQRRNTRNALWEEILKMLREYPEIALAYPTKRHVISPEKPNQGDPS